MPKSAARIAVDRYRRIAFFHFRLFGFLGRLSHGFIAIDGLCRLLDLMLRLPNLHPSPIRISRPMRKPIAVDHFSSLFCLRLGLLGFLRRPFYRRMFCHTFFFSRCLSFLAIDCAVLTRLSIFRLFFRKLELQPYFFPRGHVLLNWLGDGRHVGRWWSFSAISVLGKDLGCSVSFHSVVDALLIVASSCQKMCKCLEMVGGMIPPGRY